MRRLTKSRLFLLELMIDLLFFCICGAVCLAVFAHAHGLSVSSGELSNAVLKAESAAEDYRAAGGDVQRVAQRLGAQADDEILQLYYDARWQPTDGEAAYVLTLQQREGTQWLHTADIRVAAVGQDTPVYTLTVELAAEEEGP